MLIATDFLYNISDGFLGRVLVGAKLRAEFRNTERSALARKGKDALRIIIMILLVEAVLNGNRHGYGSANHRVVAHAEEAHHLNVRGNGG